MMNRLALCTIAVATLILPLSGQQSQAVVIHNGFLTGQQFRELPEVRKRSYAAGMIDGMLLAPLFGAAKTKLEWLENCLVGMSDEQMGAIISKYLSDHPERWHEFVHTSAYSALLGSCPNAPRN